MVHIDDLKYLELINLPEPSEVELQMTEGAGPFGQEAWRRLDTALEIYKTSYEVLFDRMDQYEMEVDSFQDPPDSELMRSIQYAREKIDAAFREASEDFRYLAEEFRAGRTQSGVIEGTAVSALANVLERGAERISAIEQMWGTRER